MDESVGVRVARPEDYDGIVAVVDEWWGRSVSPSLPRLFLDHFWSTSHIVEDEHGLAAFLIALLSPSQTTRRTCTSLGSDQITVGVDSLAGSTRTSPGTRTSKGVRSYGPSPPPATPAPSASTRASAST